MTAWRERLRLERWLRPSGRHQECPLNPTTPRSVVHALSALTPLPRDDTAGTPIALHGRIALHAKKVHAWLYGTTVRVDDGRQSPVFEAVSCQALFVGIRSRKIITVSIAVRALSSYRPRRSAPISAAK